VLAAPWTSERAGAYGVVERAFSDASASASSAPGIGAAVMFPFPVRAAEAHCAFLGHCRATYGFARVNRPADASAKGRACRLGR